MRDRGRVGGEAARRGHLQTRAQESAGQVAENETSGEEGVRLRVVAAIELIAAKFEAVLAANQRDVIGKFVAPHDGKAGKENLCSNIAKARDVQSYLARNIWINIEIGIIPLNASFIQCSRAELVEP